MFYFIKRISTISIMVFAMVLFCLALSFVEDETVQADNTKEMESISFEPKNPISLVENLNGYDEIDENNNPFFYYYLNDALVYSAGNRLILHFSDGSSEAYTFDYEKWDFVNQDGDYLDYYIDYYDNQYNNHWSVSQSNSFTIECNGFKTTVPISIVQNQIKSINFLTDSIPSTYAGLNGEYISNGNEEWFQYYTYNLVYQECNKLIVTFNDDTKKIYTYYDSKGFVDVNDEPLTSYYFDYYSNQDYSNQWNVGTHSIEVKYYGRKCSFNVQVLENPVDSIEYQPTNSFSLIEEVDGFWNDTYKYDEFLDDYVEEKYFHYELYYQNDGDKLIVHYTDSTSKIYTYSEKNNNYIDEFGNEIEGSVNVNYDQYNNHWYRNQENNFTLSYFGRNASIPVEIKENPVEHIQFELASPIELIEEYSGYWESDENGDYFKYSVYSDCLYRKGNALTLFYKDGTNEKFTYKKVKDKRRYHYGFVNQNNEEFDKYISTEFSSDQANKHWNVGNDNNLTISCYGKKTTVPVTIIENEIKSISYELVSPIELPEAGNGYYDYVGEDIYFYYYINRFDFEKVNNKLTVTYTNNSQKVFTYKYIYNEEYDEGSYEYVTDNGEVLDGYIDYSDNQNSNHWTRGGENKLTLTYKGRKTTVDVSIIENTVKEISYNKSSNIVLYENVGGYWERDGSDKYYYYDDYQALSVGDKLTVTYMDDSTKVFTLTDSEEFVSSDNVIIKSDLVDYSSKQSSNHWLKNKDNYLTYTYCGKSSEVKVSIVDNPVESISFTLAKPIRIEEGTYSYQTLDNDDNNMFYYWISSFIYEEGNAINVKYTNGSSKQFINNEDDYKFKSSDGESIEVDYYSDQHSHPWNVGSENKFYVSYMGKTCDVPVTIIDNSVINILFTRNAPVRINENTNGRIEYDDYGYDYYYYYYSDYLFSENSTIKITYNDGTNKIYRGNGDDCFVNINDDDDYLDVEYNDNQYYWPWEVGEDNYFTISYHGKSVVVPVYIVKNDDETTESPTITPETTTQDPTATEIVTTTPESTIQVSTTSATVTTTQKQTTTNQVTSTQFQSATQKPTTTQVQTTTPNNTTAVPTAATTEIPTTTDGNFEPDKAETTKSSDGSGRIVITSSSQNKPVNIKVPCTKFKKVKKSKKSLKLRWKKVHGVNGYQIQYSRSKKFKKKKTVLVKNAYTSKKTIKKLKSKTKYFVRIRTFILRNSIMFFSEWSKPKKQKTK